MTEGAQGLREQLSIGFLELSEDLTQRLPVSTNPLITQIILLLLECSAYLQKYFYYEMTCKGLVDFSVSVSRTIILF